MVLFNYATRELTAKIVYYGPGLCGKTTNLEFIHKALPEKTRGKMLSLATQTDRTLFFDFLPIDLGSVKGMKTRVQLYTVPGQVFYDATRKLVLKGADGVVFVADSQEEMLESNIDSWDNLRQNLAENGLDIRAIPLVIQYNKRDLPNCSTVKHLDKKVNVVRAPSFEAIAITGKGVQETLRGITKLVLQSLSQKYSKEAVEEKPVAEEPAPEPVKEVREEEAFASLIEHVQEEVRDLPGGRIDEPEPEDEPVSIEPLMEGAEELAMEDLEELQEVEEIVEGEEATAAEVKGEPVVVVPEVEAVAVEPEPVKASDVEPEAVVLEADAESADAYGAKTSPDAVPAREIPVTVVPEPEPAKNLAAPVSASVTLESRAAASDALPAPTELSIPVEISLGKDGQEIRVQIAVNLKIRLVP